MMVVEKWKTYEQRAYDFTESAYQSGVKKVSPSLHEAIRPEVRGLRGGFFWAPVPLPRLQFIGLRVVQWPRSQVSQMSGLQGESTLTQAEKVTEAKKLIGYLEDHFEAMEQGERTFISQMAERLEQWGDTCSISNKQLFWMRDLYEKY